MKIVFAGTSVFGLTSLESLFELSQKAWGYDLVAVYTQPDRPAGRGQTLSASPVKAFAQEKQLPLYQPQTLRNFQTQQILSGLEPDLIIVAAYGLLLPTEVLRIPQFGCINVHASLLPRWRGAAPIQNALLAGDEITGISIMQMDVGLDTGAILSQKHEKILMSDTHKSLQCRLAALGACGLTEVIMDLKNKQLAAQPQDNKKSCYAAKLTKEEAWIDWHASAEQIARRIRAFNPWPVAMTRLDHKRIRLWEANVYSASELPQGAPGTIVAILSGGIIVATGSGYLQLTYLQLEGGRCLPVSQLINGKLAQLTVGMTLQNKE